MKGGDLSPGPLQLGAARLERWGHNSLEQALNWMRRKNTDDPQSDKKRQNVRMMMLFRFFNGIAFAARAGGIFDSYIYGLFGDNKTVGLVGTLNGLASVSAAPLVGLLSDYFRNKRSHILKYCAAAAVICLVMHSYAVSAKALYLLLLSTFCWRAWYEFVFVITEALFADSVQQGQRSELFTRRRVVTSLANSAGPLVSASMLYWLKDKDGWNLGTVESLLHFALILVLPQVVCLLFWEDIPEEPSARSRAKEVKASERNDIRDVLAVECDDETTGVEIQPLTAAENQGGAQNFKPAECAEALQPVPVTTTAGMVRIGDIEVPDRRFLFFGARSVPWIIFFSHVIEFAGAGMTVKYFPLFFKTEYKVQPIQGCFLSSALTLFITGCTIMVQRVSKRIGRPQASLLFSVLGIAALFILSESYSFPLVIAMYILRGGLSNASAPIDRSMQMDYVSPSHRGKWTALESVLTVAWAFSALFGGMLADKKDYRYSFKVTGYMFLLSKLVYLPLLFLVPRSEKFRRTSKKAA